MKRIISILKAPNIGVGYLYFYIHFVTEIICFYTLAKVIGNSLIIWLIPFIYDAFAFVPQSLLGYFKDKHLKINLGLIGIFLLLLGFILFNLNISLYISVIILCLGNACIHVEGAEVTIRSSNGHLSHSAIFVSGGSFGVITGKLLGKYAYSYIFLILLGLTMVPFVLLANCYLKTKNNCSNFNYHNDKLNPWVVIILAVFVVIVRGYMGYGIPTSWNKTILQTILLYVTMGIGKALGGIFADAFGAKKIALLSVTLSLPFLLFGDNYMLVSLIGITLFSMTMSITLALLVSVLKDTPGLAFGLTTIGLFLGTAPIFFIRLNTFFANAMVISAFTIICFLILNLIIRKDST